MFNDYVKMMLKCFNKVYLMYDCKFSVTLSFNMHPFMYFPIKETHIYSNVIAAIYRKNY